MITLKRNTAVNVSGSIFSTFLLCFFASWSLLAPPGASGEAHAGQLKFDGVPVDITTASNEDLVVAPGSGGNTQIGTATGTNTHATTNNDLHVTGVLEVDGASYYDGAMFLGDTSSDTLTLNGYIGSSAIPSVDASYDLGSTGLAWRNVYAAVLATRNTGLSLAPASGYGLTGSVTRNAAAGDEIAYDLAAVINKAAGNYTGIKLSLTQTAAGGPAIANFLLDLQRDGVSMFNVDSNGNVNAVGTITGAGLAINGTTSHTFTINSNNDNTLTTLRLGGSGGSNGQLTTASGNLVIDSNGGTIDINDGTLDLATQTVDVTLNDAVDALNFDSDTLSIDAFNNRVGILTAAPDTQLHVVGPAGATEVAKFEGVDSGAIRIDGSAGANTSTTRNYVGNTLLAEAGYTPIAPGSGYYISVGGSRYLTLDTNGYLGLGDTTPVANLVVGSDAGAAVAGAGSGYIQNDLEVDGTLYAASTSIAGTNSDTFTIDTDNTSATPTLTFGNGGNPFITTPAGNLNLQPASAVIVRDATAPAPAKATTAGSLFVENILENTGIAYHYDDITLYDKKSFAVISSATGNPDYSHSIYISQSDNIMQFKEWDTFKFTNTSANVDLITLTPTAGMALLNEDVVDNAVSDILKIQHSTTNAPAAGIGTGLAYYVEDAGNLQKHGSIDTVLTTVTQGSENADMVFSITEAGVLTELMRLNAASDRVDVSGDMNVTGAFSAGSSTISGTTVDTFTVNSDNTAGVTTTLAFGGAGAGSGEISTTVGQIALSPANNNVLLNASHLITSAANTYNIGATNVHFERIFVNNVGDRDNPAALFVDSSDLKFNDSVHGDARFFFNLSSGAQNYVNIYDTTTGDYQNSGFVQFYHDGSDAYIVTNKDGTGVAGDIVFNPATGNISLNVAAPTKNIALLGTAAKTVGMERNTTADTAGNSFSVNAGGATSGATNKNGGNLYLASGVSTGSGSSSILLQTAKGGGAGDNAVAARATIDGTSVSLSPHGAAAGNTLELRFAELAAGGSNYVGFKAPDALAGNVIWTLPDADGSPSQFLKTDGLGALSWATVDTSGTTGETFTINSDGNYVRLSAPDARTQQSTITFPDVAGSSKVLTTDMSDAIVAVTLKSDVANGLNFDSDTLSIDALNNRVGIGTATPTRILSLNDATNVYNSFNTGGTERWLTGYEGGIGNERFVIYGGDGTTQDYRMVIKNSGNVGIGTTFPSGKLTIDAVSSAVNHAPAGDHLTLRVTDSVAADIGPTLSFGGSSGGATTPYTYATVAGRKEGATAYAGYLQFSTTVGTSAVISERMRIDSTGNVGIGTIAPTSPLHVDPAAQATTASTFARAFVDNTNAITTNTGNTAVHGLMIDEPNIAVGTATPTSAASLYISGAPTEATSNYALWVDDGAVQIDNNLTVGGTITGTVSGGSAITGTAADTFTVDSDGSAVTGTLTFASTTNGKVTTNAGYLTLDSFSDSIHLDAGTLDLSAQTVNVTLNAAVDALNFDSNTLSIDASGNKVGVGTASPSVIFQVQQDQDAATQQWIINAGTGTNSRSFLMIGEDGSNRNTGFGYSNNSFNIGAGYELLTANSGWVYANANATNGLAVISSNANGFIRFGTGGWATANERMRITKDGYVGIGDTSPVASLVVGSDVGASVSGAGSAYIQNNLEVDGTLYAADSSLTGTTADTFTVNSDNTTDVATTLTLGGAGTGTGSITTTVGNLTIAPNGATTSVTGDVDVSGRIEIDSANAINNNGTTSISVGALAGANNAGTANTFVGDNAGNANTSGMLNTFVGQSAGASIAITSSNTFIGAGAGSANTNGYNNVFIGDSSGMGNILGSSNIFIGHGAGQNETGSNKLYIDTSGTTTPLIYGDFSTGTVTINGTLNATTAAISGTTADTFTVNSDGTAATSTLVLGAAGTTGGQITTGAGNLTIDSVGGTIDINDGIIDLSTQTVDVTLNAAADALNFDSNTLTIDANQNFVGIGTAAPDYLLTIAPPANAEANIGMVSTSGAGAEIYFGYSGAYNAAIGYNQNFEGAIEFKTGGTSGAATKMIISSAGNVGIGTGAVTQPAAALDVQTAVTAASANAYGVRMQQTLTASANSDALSALYINPTFADGGFTGVKHNGIAFADSQATKINFGYNAAKAKWLGMDSNWRMAFAGDSGFAFYNSTDNVSWGTELMRIGGTIEAYSDVLIGTSGTNRWLKMRGNILFEESDDTIGTYGAGTITLGNIQNNTTATTFDFGRNGGIDIMNFNRGGATYNFLTLKTAGNDDLTITPGGSGKLKSLIVYNTAVGATKKAVYVDDSGYLGYDSSSIRYKDRVKDMEDTSWLYDLRPVNFVYKNDAKEAKQYGLIAEEVVKVNPLFVSFDKSGQPESVSYSQFVPVLIKSVQNQQKQIEGLKTEIDVLKEQNELLKQALSKIDLSSAKVREGERL